MQSIICNRKGLLIRMIPICVNCYMIRDNRGYWKKVESYSSKVEFNNAVCPDCLKKLSPDFMSKSNLCLTCKYRDISFVEILCSSTRALQREESTFQCNDYKKQTY